MPSLIIIGNTNIHTFANSIVAANAKAIEIFGHPLKDIFTLHSPESWKAIENNPELVLHLGGNGVETDYFFGKIIEFSSDENSIKKFVHHIEFILNGLQSNNELILDLSNGTMVQRNLLSIVGFVLDIKHQFIIDTLKLFQLTNSREFIALDILSQAYTPAPDSTQIDKIAYLNLSEIIRYKQIIKQHTDKFVEIDESSDEKFYSSNLHQSIRIKLDGDKKRDNAIYRIASTSISASIEELITQIVRKHIGETANQTLGQKIDMVRRKLKSIKDDNFDLDFFNKFNDFMRYLRNSTTHKGVLINESERFKADLALKMSFPFLDYYSDVIHPAVKFGQSHHSNFKIKQFDLPEDSISESMYFGLDGDNTGKVLEDLFVSSSDERKFSRISKSIDSAINSIEKTIIQKENKYAVIFKSGDDILFKGKFSKKDLESFSSKYKKLTNGLTCSIGFGRNFHEVFLALKMAKTQPGKNSIIGVRLE